MIFCYDERTGFVVDLWLLYLTVCSYQVRTLFVGWNADEFPCLLPDGVKRKVPVPSSVPHLLNAIMPM